MVPNVLLVQTLLWPNAARLALAFRATECRVYALCRRKYPLCTLSSVEGIYPYHPFAPLRSLFAAIKAADPHLIIPCDDPAVAIICRLYSWLDEATELGSRMRTMIARSFGNPDSYQLASTRSELASIATPAGVLLPRTSRISTVEELGDWLRREGFPAVLKVNHSWGGTGVTIIRNLQEARLAYRRMTGPQELARAIKRLLWNQEPELFLQRSRGLRPVLSIQAYIPGRPANCAVACWQGEVIASIEVEVLVTQNPTGNATVVRVIRNPKIVKTARSVARWLGISGFFGFDFVLEEASGRPYLVEINPRATQINHLALGAGRDLPTALRARISGEPIRAARAVTDCETIALFPQEWRRDPQSRFFLTAYHDVPYDEPELVRAYVAAPEIMLARDTARANPRFR